jgi:hypothetical protein
MKFLKTALFNVPDILAHILLIDLSFTTWFSIQIQVLQLFCKYESAVYYNRSNQMEITAG